MLEYEYIKSSISEIPCDNSTLKLLVTAFKKEICSQRRCESIKNIGDLIRILERRDVLNANKQEPFEEISRITGHNHRIDFENLNVPAPLQHNSNNTDESLCKYI